MKRVFEPIRDRQGETGDPQSFCGDCGSDSDL